MLGEDNKILLQNAAAEKLFGRKSAEVLGKGLEEVFLEKDKLKIFNDALVSHSGGVLPEMDIKAAGRKDVFVTTNVGLLKDATGKIISTILVFIDTTELRAKEREMYEAKKSVEKKVAKRTAELSAERGRLLSLVESVKLGVLMVDLSFNVILANSTAKMIFAKKIDEDIKFEDLDKKLSGINLSHALSYYVADQKMLNIQEIKIGENYFRLFMSPVRDINEKIFIGAVIVLENITEQKNIDRIKTEIISVTSHQLRTPLSVIRGNLEMLLEDTAGKMDKEQKNIIKEALSGDMRMIRLVNDLLDVSNVDAGRFKLLKEAVDFRKITEEVLDESRFLAENSGTSFVFEPSKEASLVLVLDARRIKQVIQNLVDNAIKYTVCDKECKEKKKIEVALKTKGRNIILSVADNGAGIPKSEQSHIFERFYRASNATKIDLGGGSGLGLFISKSIVEAHGGKLRFESTEGKGTTFYLELPMDEKK